MTLWASFVLSLLSITYGALGGLDIEKKRFDVGSRGQLLLCLFIHISTVLLTFGVCMGNASLGAFSFISPCAVVAVTYVQVATGIIGLFSDSGSEAILLAVVAAPTAVLFSIIDAVLDEQFSKRQMDVLFVPFLHRVIIMATAIACVATEPVAATAVLLGTLCFLDVFASTRMFYIMGLANADAFVCCRRENKSDLIYGEMIRELTMNGEAKTNQNENIEEAIAKGYIYVYDILEYIILYTNKALVVPDNIRPLKSCCEKLIKNLGTFSAKNLEHISASLDSYLPSIDGEDEAEKTLYHSLLSLSGVEARPKQPKGEYTHPMRSVPLANALQISLWAIVPSFFGPRSEHTPYHLSQSCDRCDWFISHSWGDDGRRKLRMLREYLFLQQFLGVWVITLLLLAAFVLPIGFALESSFESFPFWVPSVTIIGFLGTLLLWVIFSIINIVPSSFSPWSFSQQTLWLDKCCIDQSSDETKKAGIYSFDRFLDNCNGMVAFVSQSYFSRVWCVYELATFCRAIESHPERKLLLYSLEWPSSISPFRRAEVTEEEKSYFRNFNCRNAFCFKPADRGFVLRAIRRDWGSEELFNKYVRTKLPLVFAKSKAEYSNQLIIVARRSLDLLLGA